MNEQHKDHDKLDDTEAERRFNETLGRMLATPPKPHKDEPPKPRKQR